jgi:transposase
LPKSTLENWIKADRKEILGEIVKSHRPLTELEIELDPVKRELAQVKVERVILKNTAAYFAKDSLPGTR